jgi:hypothetical protein
MLFVDAIRLVVERINVHSAARLRMSGVFISGRSAICAIGRAKRQAGKEGKAS